MPTLSRRLEPFEKSHENLDDAPQDERDTDVDDSRLDDSARIGGEGGVQNMDRQIRITKKDLITYGYSPNCPRCLDLKAGVPKSNRHLSNECRFRIGLNYHDHNDPKWRAVESKMPRHPPATRDKEEINLDGMELSAMDKERLQAPPTPFVNSTPGW